VSEDVWSAQNTTPDAIDAALRELLRERHAANEALAPARVLNLVVVVDRDLKGEISNRLERVGRYTASRTVLCVVEPGRRTLDATAVMAYEEPKKGGFGVIREHVEIDLGPSHLSSLNTIVDPVLVAECPTVLWTPHGHDEAVDTLMGMIDVMLIDSDDLMDPEPALARASELLESVYVVDLAWLRTTPWRERVAATFDPPRRRQALKLINGLKVRHRPTSRASALLLSGWLVSRLRWEPGTLRANGRAELKGAAVSDGNGEVDLELDPVDQESPGLGGITITCSNGFTLSLDRGPGGLQAMESGPDGPERRWRILGASRGEGGILGEGVRQALLRDPTYGPALACARRFCQ
jgi:glucose-6-phosphate dehydrogenase assembly protein OpcA